MDNKIWWLRDSSLKISVLVLVRLGVTFAVAWRILESILNWGVPFLKHDNTYGRMMNSVKFG